MIEQACASQLLKVEKRGWAHLDGLWRASYSLDVRPNAPSFKFAFLVAAAIAGLVPVHGQLIVSNLDQANDGGAGTVGDDKWAAQGFETGGSSATLGTVGLKLAHDTSALGTFSVSLWSAAPGGLPGSQIASINSGTAVNSLTTAFKDYLFTPPQTISLSANTLYFIVLSSSVSAIPAGLLWGVTQAENPSSTGPGQIGGWALSLNHGTTWGSEAPLYQDATLGLSFPFQISISAVPEPATYAVIFGLALLGFAATRRLRLQAS
jgi:hypothetical protein